MRVRIRRFSKLRLARGVPEAAQLLDAAKHYEPKRDDLAMPFAYPLIATMLLTGGRRDEVLGLEVDDVSLERKTVTFRPNRWRRLKTKRSHRVVPLWPQLERILRVYFPERERMVEARCSSLRSARGRRLC